VDTFPGRQHHKYIYPKRNMFTKHTIPIRFLLESMAKGPNLSYCSLNELQTQTQQIHHNYQQGKKKIVGMH
jgi:hypothetical protein